MQSLVVLIHYLYLITLYSVTALEVLYDVNFTSGTMDCDALFSSYWNTVGLSYSNTSPCQKSCTRSDTNANIALLSLDGSVYTNGFQLKKQMTKAYSIIGADIVYVLDNSQVQFSLLDAAATVESIQVSSVKEKSHFSFNYSVTCPSSNSNRETSIISLLHKSSKLSSNEVTLLIQQSNLSQNSADNLMGIAQIRLWTNCVQNCDVCQDDKNCLKCFPGFKKASLPSGQRVCEQTYSSCSDSNCESCNNSIDNSIQVCNNCLFGYYVASTTCIQLHPCPIKQTYDYNSLSCVNYSTKCYLQTSYLTNQWIPCDGQVDPGDYRCGPGEHILLYDWQNYKLAKCGCTDDKCNKCLETADKCYDCYVGYSITGSQTKCTFNGTCPTDYYYDANTSTCELICSPNCDYCSANKCIYCKRDKSYYISNSNLKNCIECNLPSCKTCNTFGQCIQCNAAGIFISADKSKCEPCQVSSCLTCNSYSNQCSVCQKNYINKTNSCVCNNYEGCQSCDSSDGQLCLSCYTGYVYDGISKRCNCALSGCFSCKDQDGTKCKPNSCITGYLFDSLTEKCSCGVQNCSACTPLNGSKCATCTTGFKAVGTTICQCDSLNCATCSPTNGKKCSVCNSGYSLDSVSVLCKSNIPNCSQNNASDVLKCDACSTYYKQSSDMYACIPIINNCKQIDAQNVCFECNNGYTYAAATNKCNCSVDYCQICNSANGLICDQCTTYYIQEDASKNSCIPAISECSAIDASNKCLSCFNDYTLDTLNNKCLCSVDNCTNCYPNNGTKCQTCSNLYYPQDNESKCVPNISECLTVDAQNKCTSCVKNYIYDSLSNTCQCSVNNCQQCNPNVGSICDLCKSGYLQDATHTLCQSSTDNCIKLDPITIKCSQCQNGYQLDQINYICICSVQNCIQCDSQDGSLCLKCQNNYQMTDNQCLCQVGNCDECDEGDGQTCKTCQVGYRMNPEDGKCYVQCNSGEAFNTFSLLCEKCSVNNCQTCNQFDKQTCLQCSAGYKLDNPQVCSSQIKSCEVQKCQACFEQNSKFCLQCEAGFNLNNYQCEKIEQNSFKITQQVTSNGYRILIEFDDKIVVQNNSIDKVMDMVINNFDNYQIQSYNNFDNLQIVADLIVTENCKQNKLSVTIKDDNFIKVNNLKKRNDVISLSEYVILSQDEKSQAEAIKSTGQSIKESLLSSILPIAILGNFYVLFNTIDYTTFLYLLLFVNIRHPQNILSFCSIFQNFQMAFIPNLFNLYFIDEGYTQPYTPKKYLEQQVDAYYFNQGGQSLVIVVAVITIYFALKMLTLFDLPFRNYLQNKIESGWEYCGFIDLFGFVQVYVLLGVLLQFYKFEFQESQAFLNYAVFAISLIAVILIPIIITIFLHKEQDLTQPQIQKQFASILGGLRIAKSEEYKNYRSHSKRVYYQLKYIKFNCTFLTLRKVLFCICIIFMHDFPYLQLTCISTLNSLIASYYIYLWPHEAGYENFRNILSEFLLIAMQIVIGFLVSDEQSQAESERFLYGWVFVGLASFLIFIHVITVFLDFFKLILKILSFLYFLLKVQYITLQKYAFKRQNGIHPLKTNFRKGSDDKRDYPSIIENSHLKTQGINFDVTMNSIKANNLINNAAFKSPSYIKNFKIKHIINGPLRVNTRKNSQFSRKQSQKESINTFEPHKDDSQSDFYNSNVFSGTIGSNTATKVMVPKSKEEQIQSKSNFYQILSPDKGEHQSSFDFNPSFRSSLLEQQPSRRGSLVQKPETKFNSPVYLFQKSKELNEENKNEQNINL